MLGVSAARAAGVGRGVELGVKLRRAPIVDRGAPAKQEHWRHERVHHRNVAATISQQTVKSKGRHWRPTGIEAFDLSKVVGPE
jgi:hypothetical protein